MVVKILKRRPGIRSCSGPARRMKDRKRGLQAWGVWLRAHGRARRAFLAALAGFGAVSVVACLSEPAVRPQGGHGEGSGVEVSVSLHVAALAKGAVAAAAGGLSAMRPVDSARVTVAGPDMDTLVFGFVMSEESQTLSMMDIPPGPDRTFRTELYHGGRRLYAGQTTVELRTDRPNSVSIVCLPDFSRVTASIHIPVDFPKAVAGGHMRLWNGTDTLTTPATTTGELRVFRLEEVPGDREYTVSLALWEADGDTIASAYRAGVTVPRGQNVALVLPLALAYTQIALGMTVEDPMTTTVVLTLPGGKRTAAAFGEAVFSEVHPEPGADEGGENGEWLELFNRVSDTLDVSGCLVSRDAGTSTGMKFTLPANTVIPPGRGLVLARSASVTFAHAVMGSALNLVNTAARLEFSCGEVRLDTLRYANSGTDSLVVKTGPGKVSTLRPSALAHRHRAASWCASQPVGAAAAAGSPPATPGGVQGGCGE